MIGPFVPIKQERFIGLKSEIRNFPVFKLQLQLVRNQCNKLRIGGFSLGITDCVAKKSLQSIQIASVPGHFDGVTNGPFHTGRRGLECLCHLGVQYFCDGVDGVPAAHQTATAVTGL